MLIHDFRSQDLAFHAHYPSNNCERVPPFTNENSQCEIIKTAPYLSSATMMRQVENSTALLQQPCKNNKHDYYSGGASISDGGLSLRDAFLDLTMQSGAQCDNMPLITIHPQIKPKGLLLQSLFLFGQLMQPLFHLSGIMRHVNGLSLPPNKIPLAVSEGMSWGGLNFPAVSAAPHSYRHKKIDWDEKEEFFLIKDESVKREALNVFKTFMVNGSIMNPSQGEQFEFDWRNATAGQSLYLYSAGNDASFVRETLMRVKKVNRDKYITEHITANCAYEEEIYNAEGDNVGKELIVRAQNVENPLRMIFGDTSGPETSSIKKFMAKSSSLVFFVLSSGLTLGIAPAAQHIYASILRRQYYEGRRDKICEERQRRLIIAEFATSLMIDGIPYKQKTPRPSKIPTELLYSTDPLDRAALYINNKNTNIEREVLIKVNDGQNKGRETFIKPTRRGEANTHHVDSNNKLHLGEKVYYDKDKGEWHYVDAPGSEVINVEVIEGKSFVRMGDKKYILHQSRTGKYKVVIENQSGIVNDYPVYMEPITKTWHLSQYNGRPVFTQKQKEVIALNTLTPEMFEGKKMYRRNDVDEKRYGDGDVYDVRNAGDDPNVTSPLYSVVEVYGRIVKLHIEKAPGGAEKFTVRGTLGSKKKIYPLLWDGHRWIFERVIPLNMSKALAERIITNIRGAKIDMRTLSSPDEHGLRWDLYGRAYLQIKNKFFRFWPSRLDKEVFSIRDKLKKINVVHQRGLFREETLGERLKRLKTVGLSGRGAPAAVYRMENRSTIDVIKTVFGLDTAEAKAYLAQYRFEKTGLYNEREFVRYIEQHEQLPQWAERFKHNDEFNTATLLQRTLGIEGKRARQYLKQYHFEPSGPHSEKAFAEYISQYRVLPVWAEPYRIKGIMEHLGEIPPAIPGPDGKKIALGRELGQGQYGTTYIDARDARFVIKKLKTADEIYSSVSGSGTSNTAYSDSSYDTDYLRDSALDEADLFQRYYGIGTAEMIVEEQSVYIRMIRIPGVPIYALENGEMAADSAERLVDMLERMTERGILHTDLHDGNVLYHEGEFYPIDLSNNYDSYFYSMPLSGKAEDNTHSQRQFTSLLNNILGKQRKKGDVPPVASS